MSTKRPSPSTPEKPPKRSRGRPPGSKNKASSTTTTTTNGAASTSSPTSGAPTATPRNPPGISLEEASYIFDSLHDGANWSSIVKHTNEHLAPAGVSRQPGNVKLHWAKTVRKAVLALYKPQPQPQPQPMQRNLLVGVEVLRAEEEEEY